MNWTSAASLSASRSSHQLRDGARVHKDTVGTCLWLPFVKHPEKAQWVRQEVGLWLPVAEAQNEGGVVTVYGHGVSFGDDGNNL